MSSGKDSGWFLGIDLGTGSCKCAVLDLEGRLLGFGSSEYPGAEAVSRWQEQVPDGLVHGLLAALQTAVQQAGVQPRECLGLSLGGALHSLIPVDRQGKPLSSVITWADGRGAAESQAVRSSRLGEELYQRTGCPAHGMYPLYKIAWLRRERPEIFVRAARFLSAKEYIFHKITGEYCVDYSIASGSGLLNTYSLTWEGEALSLAGIEAGRLSPLVDPVTVYPGLHGELGMALGLPVDTPVVLGSSDAANSNLGAGAVNPWQATCMIGTSGAFRVITPQPALDAHSRTWCYALDRSHWLVGGAINNGGIALSWLRDAIQPGFRLRGIQEPLAFDDLIELASEIEAGAGGVICLPFFAGERSPNWNLNARATFFGLALQHDLRHLARAVLEGVAFRFRSLYDILAEMVGEIREVRASGGYTKSALWPQIIASVIDRELLVPRWGETSAVGAALWAMHGVGRLPSLEAAEQLIAIRTTYQPDQRESELYHRLYGVYAGLYESLRPTFDSLVEIQVGTRGGKIAKR